MPWSATRKLATLVANGYKATDVDALRTFLRDHARVSDSVIEQVMDKLRGEEVFEVEDLHHLRKMHGLADVFSRVTASKVADALDALQQPQTSPAAGLRLAATPTAPQLDVSRADPATLDGQRIRAAAELTSAPPPGERLNFEQLEGASDSAAAAKEVARLLHDGSSAGAKEDAADKLRVMARHEDNRVAIVAAGGIAPLIELTRSGTAGAMEHAAGALANLAQSPGNKDAIAAMGGIESLIELARSSHTVADKKWVAAALSNLARRNPSNQAMIAVRGGIAPLVELTRSGTATMQAACALSNLAYNNVENQMAIVAMGGIQSLIELARSGTTDAKEKAALTLWLLAYNNQEAVAAACGIVPLVELTRSGAAVAKENAAGALMNLAADSDENKRSIVAADGIAPLVELTRSGSAVAKKNAAGVLLSLAANTDENKVAIVAAGGIVPLTELTRSGTADAKQHAERALRHLEDFHDAMASQVDECQHSLRI